MRVATGLGPGNPRRQVKVTRHLFVDEMKGVRAEPHVLSATLHAINATRCIEVCTPRQPDLTDVGMLFENADLPGLDTWQADHRERENLEQPEVVA